jgi:integrase
MAATATHPDSRRDAQQPRSYCSIDVASRAEDSAHALRHTVATRLVRDHRHDLVLVADILGHADVKTTRHYARSGLEDRRAALEDLAD